MGKEETTKKTLEPLNIFVSHLTHTWIIIS
jgi:hypothetical protein